MDPARKRKGAVGERNAQRAEQQLPERREEASRAGSGKEEKGIQESGWIRRAGAVERLCPVRPRSARQGSHAFI